MSRYSFLIPIAFVCLSTLPCTAKDEIPGEANRILFLGDSITHAGHYIDIVETHLRTAHPKRSFEMINLGLPSETCSGLSEPEHPFPRPDVHERLDRALTKIKPDLVVACYGMNDGIYYPFSEERFAAYKKGISKLIAKVREAGAPLILMSPPAFDPLPLKKSGKLLPKGEEKYAWFNIYENYDSEVLKPYANWVTKPREHVLMSIDLHTPVNDYVAAKRTSDPSFTMSPDGVHVNQEGHRVLAQAILAAWGYDPTQEINPKLAALIGKRQRLTHAAYVSFVGHKRPGVKPGLPIDEAREEASKIEAEIQSLLNVD